ncbi:hypothetical protein IEQ34_004752 [Dendrobium chrysotoxum]|uniref:Uncharacterized protein n=1 Tax=Dendrobium chrysotoxum TaxID=161865 RepID=A0AAV7HHA9_DENCH|nr:hypothetical protein IEQ34_004752 [Dendrobium chrysotoxum]
MQWLRKPSNEHPGTDLYINISLLSVVGHGGILESLKMNRPPLDTLYALQKSLKSKIMSKKFLLVLYDIWDEEEE